MAKTLYLECDSGISGDMTVAALLDLGADAKVLMDALESLPVEGYSIEISRVKKAGIDACDFNVKLDKEHENHDHDMEYLHGDNHSHEHNHSDHNHDEYEHHHSHHHSEHNHDEYEHHHSHHHSAHHEHSEEHHHEHHHSHQHTSLADVMHILKHGTLSEGAYNIASKIFYVLAEAEAKAHDATIDTVHFHEVGAVDSIVDITAVAVCLDNLGIEHVIVPKLCEGTGTIRCQHGILPVPVPAVANIVSAHQIPLEIMNVQGEFVTPTGAAIVAATKTGEKLPDTFTIEKIGIGAGKRNYERPSLLRAMLIKESEKKKDCIYKLESNIDDCTGEALGYVMDKLMDAGARDVHYTPVFMKKNRPAYQLNVICTQDKVSELEDIIFAETTTIGIRRVKMERSVLDRKIISVDTSLGEIMVKECKIGEEVRRYPEYESVAKLARDKNLSYQEVYLQIIKEI